MFVIPAKAGIHEGFARADSLQVSPNGPRHPGENRGFAGVTSAVRRPQAAPTLAW
jgi:hypothetical protein